MTPLEVLRIARERVSNSYVYLGGWECCTCGHIYSAANDGKIGSIANISYPKQGLYADTIKVACKALGYDTTYVYGPLVISDATHFSAGSIGAEKAFALLDKVIKHLEETSLEETSLEETPLETRELEYAL